MQFYHMFSSWSGIEKDVIMRHWFQPHSDHVAGNFRAANSELLALFSDPDARGGRSWRETFGYEAAPRSRSQIAADQRARKAEIVV